MSTGEIKSTELAKELGIKSTEVVTILGEIRNIHFKKGTTNIKLTVEESEKIRSIIRGRPGVSKEVFRKDELSVPPIEAPKRKSFSGDRSVDGELLKTVPPAVDMKPAEELRKTQEKKIPRSAPVIPEEVLPDKAVPVKEDDEVQLPGRFLKDLEVEKVEKFKVKPGMQKAFQTIRKVEPKKPADVKSGKRQKFKFRRSEQSPQYPVTAPRKKTLKIQEGTTVKEFSELIGQKISDVIKKFIDLGYMLTVNQSVDIDAAILVAEAFGIKIEAAAVDSFDIIEETEEDGDLLVPRSPVITIMGHVDHGKTSLLDAIRETKVTETEAGGITQHIGAYRVEYQNRSLTFLDTPGHEAFTALRARGAKVTDIVVLVVAADDGVMPQTIEAVNHAKAANVAVVVAINKIDKPGVNISRVKNELAEHGIVSEEWGGQTIFAEVSAKKRIGIESLLEMLLLQAEVLELKANPDKPARGTIIESKLDKGRGPVATVLIQAGSLSVGDAFVAGTSSGKVRALIDDTGKKISSAGPSFPVEVIGFSDVPTAGDVFNCVEDEKRARQIALVRQQKQRTTDVIRHAKMNLEELYAKIKEGQIKELNIIIKGDAQGTVEAIRKAFEDIHHPEVKVRVIHSTVGGINESDVMLGTASNAIIIGFNVRPETKASQIAEKEGVDIRLYNIIYEAIESVKKALEGMLEPTFREKILGRAEVRQTFNVSRLGTIAGCYVLDGTISRASDGIRVIRNNIVVYEGKIGSLKRFKEDIRDVQTGYECGIMVDSFNDLKTGDILENYQIEQIAGKLEG